MSKKQKALPYDPESTIGPKKKRGTIAPFFDIFMLTLPVMAGIFAASLELTKEGIVNVSQKNMFDKLMIKKS